MKNKNIAYLIIGLFFIAFIIGGFSQAAENNVISGEQIQIAQAKGKKGGPPGGKGKGKGAGKGGAPSFGLRPAEDLKQIYDRKKALLRLDINGDNSISTKEYDGPPRMFKELDTNGDGKMSFEEAKWMMTFSPIPSGSFIMGSEKGKDDAKPVHKVSIDVFQMGTTEVTNAQYCIYLNSALAAGEITVKLGNAGGGGTRIFIPIPAYLIEGAPGTKYAGKPYTLLSPVTGLSHIKLDGHPLLISEHPLNQSWITYVPELKRFFCNPGFMDWSVSHIRWYGAYAYAEHYGLSLPTEAQWEYVAKGGRNFEWATHNGKISCKNANYKCFAGTRSRENHIGPDTPDEWIGYRITVGSYKPNPFGVFDLGGNVWEWTLDWYRKDFYQYCVDNNITSNPVNLDGEEPPMDGSAKGGPRGGFTHDARVKRGGSYQYHTATLGTSFRSPGYPFRGNDHFGFRVVLN